MQSWGRTENRKLRTRSRHPPTLELQDSVSGKEVPHLTQCDGGQSTGHNTQQRRNGRQSRNADSCSTPAGELSAVGKIKTKTVWLSKFKGKVNEDLYSMRVFIASHCLRITDTLVNSSWETVICPSMRVLYILGQVWGNVQYACIYSRFGESCSVILSHFPRVSRSLRWGGDLLCVCVNLHPFYRWDGQSSQFLVTKPLGIFYRDCCHVNTKVRHADTHQERVLAQEVTRGFGAKLMICVQIPALPLSGLCPETSYPSSPSPSFLIYKMMTIPHKLVVRFNEVPCAQWP